MAATAACLCLVNRTGSYRRPTPLLRPPSVLGGTRSSSPLRHASTARFWTPLEDTGMGPVYQRPASCPTASVSVAAVSSDCGKWFPRVFHVFESTPCHVKLPFLSRGAIAVIHNCSHTKHNTLGCHMFTNLGRGADIVVAVVLEARPVHLELVIR
ncbi:uncharacterized protein PITG_13505 [Phytophthora infestans T30-4]|uniref:Uncharacterized protein n=1 Tax=Phytophthora infestans (strain T30-4) TaxID=403677 RepID=D0NM58_PHYIT|nr:uncharacterized protein PITG_13505 [Phytophthora infestans T30-4]EEY60779.1 hypothetical protein PITG_13505 [Phytophthora infestans T30-4]|eukprot:XP_002899725.1 hypothetical protein PITG_13505 [Phytophthora infestans T30-4]